MKQPKKAITNPALLTWVSLNEIIIDANEEECEMLLKEELEGRARRQFVRRIHSRMNRLRGRREKLELDRKMGVGG